MSANPFNIDSAQGDGCQFSARSAVLVCGENDRNSPMRGIFCQCSPPHLGGRRRCIYTAQILTSVLPLPSSCVPFHPSPPYASRSPLRIAPTPTPLTLSSCAAGSTKLQSGVFVANTSRCCFGKQSCWNKNATPEESTGTLSLHERKMYLLKVSIKQQIRTAQCDDVIQQKQVCAA